MLELLNCPKRRLLKSFRVLDSFDNEAIFTFGSEVNVLCKVDIAEDGLGLYAIYSSDVKEVTIIHERFLEEVE